MTAMLHSLYGANIWLGLWRDQFLVSIYIWRYSQSYVFAPVTLLRCLLQTTPPQMLLSTLSSVVSTHCKKSFAGRKRLIYRPRSLRKHAFLRWSTGTMVIFNCSLGRQQPLWKICSCWVCYPTTGYTQWPRRRLSQWSWPPCLHQAQLGWQWPLRIYRRVVFV